MSLSAPAMAAQSKPGARQGDLSDLKNNTIINYHYKEGLAIGRAIAKGHSQSIAIGPDSFSATDERAAKATGHGSVAIGSQVTASGDKAVAIGGTANAAAKNSVAIGAEATVGRIADENGEVGQEGIAIGKNAIASVDKAVVIGSNTNAQNQTGAVIIGSGASTAQGRGNNGYSGTRHETYHFHYNNPYTSFKKLEDGVADANNKLLASSVVAVGQKSHAEYGGVAIGDSARVESKFERGLGVAIGASATSRAGGVVVGAAAETQGVNAVAVGRQAVAVGGGSQAYGVGSAAVGNKSLAMGHSSTSVGERSIAIGTSTGNSTEKYDANTNTESYGVDSIAIGSNAKTGVKDQTNQGTNAIAIGKGAQATAVDSISIGTGNLVNAENAGAIGDLSIVSGAGSYTLGNDNAVGSSSANTGAFGNNNQIGATATYDDNGKLQLANGLADTVDATGSRVVGNNNAITSKDTYVLGSGINTGGDGKTRLGETVANSVYLGNDSSVTAGAGSVTEQGKGTLFNASKNATAAGATTTGGATGTVSTAKVNGISYSTFAGQTAVGAVSVGAAGAERRIQNVAAGEISSTSTDAINGSQLYLTQDRLGNVAKAVVNNFGGNAALNPDKQGDITFTNIGDTGKNNIHDAIKAAKSTVAAGTNVTDVVATGNADGSKTYTVNANGTTVSNGSEAVTVLAGKKDKQNVTDYKVDLSQASKDSLAKADTAVQELTTSVNGNNVETLNQSNKDIGFVNGTGTTARASGSDITFDVNKSGLTTDEAGKVTANTAGDNFATAADVANAINEAAERTEKTTTVVNGSNTHVQSKVDGNNTEYTVSADKATVSVSDALKKTETSVTDATTKAVTTDYALDLSDATKAQIAKKESVVAGDNVTVTEDGTNDTGGKKYKVALKNNLNLGNTGSVTTGNTTINNDGLKVGDVTVTNAPVTVNGTTVNNINDSINQTAIQAFKPLTFAGDSGNNVTRKLGETVNVKGGVTDATKLSDGNIGVVANGSDTLDIKLAKDITVDSVKAGNTTINNNGITITDGPTITKEKVDVAGNKITNVKAGEKPTDAVNVSQLEKAQKAATTKVEGDQGVTVTHEVSKEDGSTTYTVAAKTDGVTTKVDKAGNIAAVTSDITADDKGVSSATTPTALATAGDVAEAINASGFNVKSGGNKAEGDEAEATLINPGEEVEFNAGKNLTVKRVGNVFTYATADDVAFNTVTATTVTTGDTALNSDGLTINNGPSVTKTGIDAAGTQITNVKAGEKPTDAVNVSQLEKAQKAATTKVEGDQGVTVTHEVSKEDGSTTYTVAAKTDGVTTKVDEAGNIAAVTSDITADDKGVSSATTPTALATAGDVAEAINNSGFTLTAQGENGSLVKPGSTVDMKNTDGNIVISKSADSNDVVYNLAKNITVDSVKAGDTTISNEGVKNGDTSLTKDGITINNGTAGKPVTLTKDGLDNGGNKITNVKAGKADTDAVNVSQLKAAQAAATTKVGGDQGVTVTPKVSQQDGSTTYTVAAKTDGVTTEVDTNGNIAAITGDITTDGKGNASTTMPNALATAQTVTDAINNSGFTAKANGDTGEFISSGDEVNFVDGKNITIKRDGANFTVATKDDVDFNTVTAKTVTTGDSTLNSDGLTINNGPSVTKTGIDAADKKITNVAAGKVAADSKDAVNGSQLYATANSVANHLGGGSTVNADGTVSAPSYTLTNPADGSTTAVNNVGDAISGLDKAVNQPLTFAGDSGDNVNRKLGQTVNVKGGVTDTAKLSDGNIGVVANGSDTLEVKLAKDVNLGQEGSLTTGNTVVNNNGVTIAAPTEANPQNTVSISPIGLNNGGNTITNVAPGKNGTDAVNVNQLVGMGNQLQQNIDNVGKKAYAGVAGAIAQSSIPQVTRPGATGLGIGGGHYGGESAMAIGVSSMSDGGNWIIKGNFSTNTGGHVGVGAGALYQW
ncbi:hypothetical protein CRG49_001655 [Neisseria sp. N95_16]|nr:hypothetical protein CRG49_001655 [Neisseria sp. N95_16]